MAETGGLCSYWGSTPTALPLGKEPWYPSDRLAGPQSQFGRFAEMNLLLLPAIKPPFLGPQAVTVGLLTTVDRVPAVKPPFLGTQAVTVGLLTTVARVPRS